MQSKSYDNHNAQFSFEVRPMGTIHVNMNSTATANLKAGRLSGDSPRPMNTKRTERTNTVAKSQNTSNALSSSMAGKSF